MIIYNTSYILNSAIEKDFCKWMNDKFIPLVKETGTFSQHYFCKVMVQQEDGSQTYSLQLFFKNKAQLDKYNEVFEPRCKAIFAAKYQTNILTFSSTMFEQDVNH
ncbi:DUF4286 family protein [Ancylomarina euxinus]|uniref:DUF4286 family protein n=1 Tax=Ancylomarina euxinus TaxID=2283627 RepID=A0A425Y934_9BACT|nr:DUF4286 family protein [Ancylomarina euxinus]MCZ4693277.1 DUF4286 family protein [Ancylomarina euxinus]MUP13504.1 DUF4286 family protein [Ancylomarina euxinus]RRG24844.1 DUF4286 family protein [Ancylomarina euxinus]